MQSVRNWFKYKHNNLFVAGIGIVLNTLILLNVSKQAYAQAPEQPSASASAVAIRPVDLFQALSSKEVEITEEVQEQKEGCLSSTFTDEVKFWEKDICRWSEEHHLDPDLIATVMQIESCGNYLAISATGVRGLFQVTGANLDGQDPYDPNVSMAKGPGKVLKAELAAANGNIHAAMAGYNGGGKARDWIAGNLSRYQFYWFLRGHSSGYWWTDAKASAKLNEVERYAQWANIYFEAKEGRTDTLQEWLDLGGARLCTEASQTLAENPPHQEEQLTGPITASQEVHQ